MFTQSSRYAQQQRSAAYLRVRACPARQYPHQEHASPLYDSCETLVDAARGSPLIRKKTSRAELALRLWRSAAAARGRQHPLSRRAVAAVIPEISFHPPPPSGGRMLKTRVCVQSSIVFRVCPLKSSPGGLTRGSPRVIFRPAD